MIDGNELIEFMRANRLDRKHEIHGFPNGWNQAMEFVELQVKKLAELEEHKFERAPSSN